MFQDQNSNAGQRAQDQDLGTSSNLAVPYKWPDGSIPECEYRRGSTYQFSQADSPIQSVFLQGETKYAYLLMKDMGLRDPRFYPRDFFWETASSLAGHTRLEIAPYLQSNI